MEQEGYIWEYEQDDPIVGSCDICGCDLFASECNGLGLCDQCRWWDEQASEDRGE
jgi:hypothetical protein